MYTNALAIQVMSYMWGKFRRSRRIFLTSLEWNRRPCYDSARIKDKYRIYTKVHHKVRDTGGGQNIY